MATPEFPLRHYHRACHDERLRLLQHINTLVDRPLVFLSFVWIGLVVVDFTNGLSPLLRTTSDAIWGLFILDFVVELTIAPRKLSYLRQNWLTALSLLLPAFRMLRIFQ